MRVCVCVHVCVCVCVSCAAVAEACVQLSPELTTSPTAQYGTTTESLEKQFEIVKKETTTSHVSQYGQMVSRGGEEK